VIKEKAVILIPPSSGSASKNTGNTGNIKIMPAEIEGQ
jgi:hypothetical protein